MRTSLTDTKEKQNAGFSFRQYYFRQQFWVFIIPQNAEYFCNQQRQWPDQASHWAHFSLDVNKTIYPRSKEWALHISDDNMWIQWDQVQLFSIWILPLCSNKNLKALWQGLHYSPPSFTLGRELNGTTTKKNHSFFMQWNFLVWGSAPREILQEISLLVTFHGPPPKEILYCAGYCNFCAEWHLFCIGFTWKRQKKHSAAQNGYISCRIASFLQKINLVNAKET